MVENSARMGAYILDGLRALMDEHPIIGNVRGRGLLLGIELVSDRDTKTRYPKETQLSKRLAAAFEAESLILNAGDERLSIGPPLCITQAEADELINKLDRAFGRVERGLAG